jgi:hypothetical protein
VILRHTKNPPFAAAFENLERFRARVSSAHRRRDGVALGLALQEAEAFDCSATLVALARWLCAAGLGRIGEVIAALGFAVAAGLNEEGN